MAYQTQSNAYIARKVQSALGAQASGSDAKLLFTTGGQQGRMNKDAIESRTIRPDALSIRGRHGIQKTNASYDHELFLGMFDDEIEAIMRGTWAAALTLTEADFTSITTGANTIVFASGSPIALGIKVGDVIRLANHSSSGNNGRNLRVTAVSATTITVAETLTVNASADNDVDIVRSRKVTNPASALVKRYFTVEEHELDIDGSEIFTDCVWGNMRFSMQPNGLVLVTTGWTGTGKFETKTGGDVPHFTSPAAPTGLPMSVVEATIRLGSEDLADLTSFEISLDITPSSPPVITPPSSPYSPDVFPGSLMVGMNFTALRKDLLRVADYLDETQLSLHVLMTENESAPEDFLSIYVPNFTLGSVDKSALAKEGGPRTQTIAVPPALVGVDGRGGAYDSGMIKFQTSTSA